MKYSAYLIATGLVLSPLSYAGISLVNTKTPIAAIATISTSSTSTIINPAQVLIVINDSEITQADYDAYALVRNRQSKKIVSKKVIVEELIARELLYQAALTSGIERDPIYLSRLEIIRYNLLSESMMRHYLAAHPISDETVQKTYDELPNRPEWPTEYQTSHILLDDEALAKAVIVELKAGKDFAVLAQEKSNDTGSAAQKGSLGWVGLRDMVPTFGNALAALTKGKYSDTPIKTKFGWHVILLNDTRPLQLPKFDSVKDRLRQNLENDLMATWSQELRTKAKVDIRLKLDDSPALSVGQ